MRTLPIIRKGTPVEERDRATTSSLLLATHSVWVMTMITTRCENAWECEWVLPRRHTIEAVPSHEEVTEEEEEAGMIMARRECGLGGARSGSCVR